ncbi:hypothetical protein [Novosphingobium sp. 9]|uniref:hypothetical protein n=1 Tax=Novosphingobium sp. 9 TaxID=2025349 RepID=UPI0021B6672F|nr:hypothetical protein [Novosphingobium sp. 9]
MGLHLTSIAQINAVQPQLAGVRYFVYIINYYDIEEDVIDELVSSVPKMNAKFSQSGNVVSISALKNLHFGNEALSWDNCFGPEADETCPAILICTLPPFYFIPKLLAQSDSGQDSAATDVPWILLSLKDRGKDINDLREIIEKVVKEVAAGEDISSFEAVKLLHTIDNRPVINAEIGATGDRLSEANIFRRLEPQDHQK